MHRRGFLGALLGATAVSATPLSATAPPAPVLRPTPLSGCTLREFNAQWPQYPQGDRLGDYSLTFTGLKTGLANSWLVGQWLAWPVLPPGRRGFASDARYFYAPVPGAPSGAYEPVHAAEYTPGAVFRIYGGLEPHHLCSAEGLEAVYQEIEIARFALQDYLVTAGVI